MNDTFGAAHLSYLQMQIARPLRVFLPPLRRGMDSLYVNRFWETGELRLSSFRQFAKNESDDQHDDGEGTGFHVVQGQGQNFAAMTATGSSAYVLSFTTSSAPQPAFGDDWFEVVEAIGFCAEVAGLIPGCTAAMIGPCIYLENRIFETEGHPPSVDDLLVGDGSTDVSFDKLLAASAALQGPKQYFAKPRGHRSDPRGYEKQAEFRMIWETSRSAEDHILVRAPELLRFCEKRPVSV